MGVDTKWLADRIEQLAVTNEELISERDEAWKRAAHAEKMWGEAEVKLAKAVEALTAWKYYDESDEQDHVSLMLNYADAIEKTRTTLAELTSSEAAYGEAKGGKDE